MKTLLSMFVRVKGIAALATFGAGRTTPQVLSASALLLIWLLSLATAVSAATAVQPGVYYHESPDISLQLTGIQSGLVCSARGGPSGVCETGIKIVIAGGETCEYQPGTEYPCTRFGYDFEYSGADPGSTIDCKGMRQDSMGRTTSGEYNHTLSKDSGRVFYETYRTYAPVEKRTILSEVHECSYKGDRLASIEYIIYYEPAAASEPADSGDGTVEADRHFSELPNACSAPYLDERRATGILDATEVQPSVANEHFRTLRSQCIYTSKRGIGRQVGFVYKFMLTDMFDVHTVDPMLVEFNATFASGNPALRETRDDLGDRGFLFQKGDYTSLFVITSIRGPQDAVGRDQEFIASYYLDDGRLTQGEREDILIDEARRDLREWGVSEP